MAFTKDKREILLWRINFIFKDVKRDRMFLFGERRSGDQLHRVTLYISQIYHHRVVLIYSLSFSLDFESTQSLLYLAKKTRRIEDLM